MIGYDDWSATSPQWETGESRAHKEVALKYGVDFQLLFSRCRAHGETGTKNNPKGPCMKIPQDRCAKKYAPHDPKFNTIFRVNAVRGEGAGEWNLC